MKILDFQIDLLHANGELHKYKYCGRMLIALDGTEYHSSNNIRCECCNSALKGNYTRYYHSILAAAIVNPDYNIAIPLRPEFIKFSDDGIKVKIKRVSDTGRHKVIDTECSSGSIKILANASTEIPSDSAHITFEQKYTYIYGDDWIVE